MIMNNIDMLQNTLNCFSRGSYTAGGKNVALAHSLSELKEARVFLPEEVRKIAEGSGADAARHAGRCAVSCENTDSFSMARKLAARMPPDSKKPVLVLNFANPVYPGGGVRQGARAQEEDLCRKSSLLLSLESDAAAPYYAYNARLRTDMGSDAIILSPAVEIIRDEQGELLPDPVTAAVLTCAAPMINYGLENMMREQYREMFRQRIVLMLKCAAAWGYRDFVLGAWGCGAFGNDAAIVSDLFRDAMKEIRAETLFSRIAFAVLGRGESYNLREFRRNFGSARRDDPTAAADGRSLNLIPASETDRDAIRGCLIGGAAGNALGFPVEFLREPEIFAQFGTSGIQEYALSPNSGKALISDDTQMTLFTADCVSYARAQSAQDGTERKPSGYAGYFYLDWYRTQTMSFSEVRTLKCREDSDTVSRLTDVPELFSLRAPGSTCMNAIYTLGKGRKVENDSKGCGGIMHVAPIGCLNGNGAALDYEGASVAGITHRHSLGYMPAAVLTHILRRCIFDRRDSSLKDIAEEAVRAAERLFGGDPNLGCLAGICEKAIRLSANSRTDLQNIHELGEGWVAEETLAIALYCALRHEEDFSAGITAAVNHNGDSDSTGAVTGNILGAWLGYAAIGEKWKRNLELRDVILEEADCLCREGPACYAELSSR